MVPFRSYEHLLRLAGLFAVGVALFLTLRWLLVPSDYGRLGPYRASALAQNQARPIVYAGQVACVECHTDVLQRPRRRRALGGEKWAAWKASCIRTRWSSSGAS